MGNCFSESMATNLRRPNNSCMGWFAKSLMTKYNAPVEQKAIELCDVQPHYQVLEVGFGPGVGLEIVYNIVKDKGRIVGIDISEYMLSAARKKFRREISTGSLVLQEASVTSIPYSDATFHCIYHTNCYYFWDDMTAATSELRRVVKPGGRVVTAFMLQALKDNKERGILKYGQIEPERYIDGMKDAGFSEVAMRETEEGIHVVVAYAPLETAGEEI